MKFVYHYSTDGFYLRSEPARESQRERGVYRLPKSATFIAPPTVTAGKLAKYDIASGSWLVVDDPRVALEAEAKHRADFYLLLRQVNAHGIKLYNSDGTAKPDAQVDQETRAALLAQLRNKRDVLLSQTDFTQLADAPPSVVAKRAEYVAYRQALRDLPANTIDPANPIWPVKP